MGDPGRRFAVIVEDAGELREAGGGFLGHLGGRLGRFQILGMVEQVAEDLELRRDEQVFQRERIHSGGRVGEVGVDLDGIDVADDQQRWVFQRFAVLLQLAVGFNQVGVLALVFPGEMAPIPDIRKALLAGQFFCAGFEGKEIPVGVHFDRHLVVHQPARSIKCDWYAERSLSVAGLPPGDELLGCER